MSQSMTDGSHTVLLRSTEEELWKMFTRSRATGRSASDVSTSLQKNTPSSYVCTGCADVENKIINLTTSIKVPTKFHLQCIRSQRDQKGGSFPARVRFYQHMNDNDGKIIRNCADRCSACCERFCKGSAAILTCQVMQTYRSMGRVHQK